MTSRHTHVLRGRVAVVLLLSMALPLAGCSNGAATDPITLPPPSSTTHVGGSDIVSTTSAPTSSDIGDGAPTSTGTIVTTSTPPVTTTPDVVASGTETTSTTPTTSSDPASATAPTTPSAKYPVVGIIPPRFTGKKRADAQAAIKAYQGMWTVFDKASAHPRTKDWEPDIRKFAAGPAADELLFSIEGFAEHGFKQVGKRWAVAAVTRITGPDVYLHECLDLSHADVVDTDGKSVLPADSGKHVASQVIIENFGKAGWLVIKEGSDEEKEC